MCQPKAEEEAERQMSVALEAQQRQSTRPKSNGWAVNRTMTESGISSSVRNTQDYFGASLLATERMLT